MQQEQLPSQYKPLSPWGYFWLQILFSLPGVGFVFLIIFSISGSNVNRRNFARSYFCVLVLAIIVVVIIMLTGGSAALLEYLSSLSQQA